MRKYQDPKKKKKKFCIFVDLHNKTCVGLHITAYGNVKMNIIYNYTHTHTHTQVISIIPHPLIKSALYCITPSLRVPSTAVSPLYCITPTRASELTHLLSRATECEWVKVSELGIVSQWVCEGMRVSQIVNQWVWVSRAVSVSKWGIVNHWVWVSKCVSDCKSVRVNASQWVCVSQRVCGRDVHNSVRQR